MFKARPYEPRDAGRLAEIMKLIWPYPTTAEDIQASYTALLQEPGAVAGWFVAVDQQGRVVGATMVNHRRGAPAGQFSVVVFVDDAYRGRGVGRLLYPRAERLAREYGATGLEAQCRGGDTTSLEWACRRGFGVDRVRTEAILDLATWSNDRFADQLAKVAAGGIRLLLASKAEAEPYFEGICTVNEAAWADVPSLEGEPPSRERFLRSWQDNSEPTVIGIALDGDRVVGFSQVYLPLERGGVAGIRFTGVLREYRGRSIALAVKLITIPAAIAAGATTMRTQSDPDNPAMLHVNAKLGFRAVPGPNRLKKRLD